MAMMGAMNSVARGSRSGFLQPQRGAILMHGRGEAPRQIGPILAVRRRALDDFVIDIGDVAHVGHFVAQ